MSYFCYVSQIAKSKETDFEQSLLPISDYRKATNCTQSLYYQTISANCQQLLKNIIKSNDMLCQQIDDRNRTESA